MQIDSKSEQKQTSDKTKGKKIHWYKIYFILAAMDLFAIMFSLYINYTLTEIFAESTEINRTWSQRQAQIDNLSALVTKVNAPGNDVFSTRNVQAERERFSDYILDYEIALEKIQIDLHLNLSRTYRKPILNALNNANDEIERMAQNTRNVFRNMTKGKTTQAGRSMAKMDQHFGKASEHINTATAIVRKIQQSHFASQHQLAEELRKYEFIISGLILLMVLGMVLYGHQLAKRMRRVDEEREEYWYRIEKNEKAICESELKLRTILETLGEGVIVLDADSNATFVNRHAHEVLGYSGDELIGKNMHHTIHHSYADGKPYPIEECPILNRGSKHCNPNVEVRVDSEVFWTRDGKPVPVEYVATSLRHGEDTTMGTVLVFRDITERKAIEENNRQAKVTAEDAARAKSEFLATMSHEIRTPLNGVIGVAQMLRGTELDEQQTQYVEVVNRSAFSLLSIINDILDFSKLEAGKMGLDYSEFSLEELVDSVFDVVRSNAENKGIELIGSIASQCPKTIFADRGKLFQILMNLAGNAVKFTDKGYVMIQLEMARKAGKSHTYELSAAVVDTGIGVDEAARKKIFGEFSQADASTTRQFGGTGLGLAISKRLVDLMGGQIDVEPNYGGGSRFKFEIQVTTRHEKFVESSDIYDQKQILLVDDVAVNRRVLCDILENTQAHCSAVRSADDALADLANTSDCGSRYDLLVLDSSLPDMKIHRLINRVRKLRGYQQTPIAVLQVEQTSEWVEKLNSKDNVTLISKPVSRSRLFQYIDELWSESSQRVDEVNTVEATVVPLRSAASVPSDSAEASSEPGVADISTILLVEDNEVNQLVAGTMLQSMGYQVTFAYDGVQALDAWAKEKFDVILMDCQMPNMDGYEATRRIREEEKAHSLPYTKIIALTANALEGDREKCLAAGMDDYLVKPFSREQLGELVKRGLKSMHEPEENKPGLDTLIIQFIGLLQQDKRQESLHQLFLIEQKIDLGVESSHLRVLIDSSRFKQALGRLHKILPQILQENPDLDLDVQQILKTGSDYH